MELRVLRYFLAVAREETISGAAEYLHVTQPTLSRQMMELEEELGKKLFIRGNRKISLTEEGMFLRKRAQEIVALVDRTESEFSVSDENISGDVSIGGGETDAMRLIAQVARELQCQHPNIRFHLHSGNAEDVTERLDKGLLDFGLLIEPTDIKKYDYIRLPAQDTWGVLLRKDHPLAARPALSPQDLLDQPLIISRQRMVRGDLAVWFQRDLERLNIVATYNLVYNAARMVEEGVGCALTLDKLINTTGESLLCFRPLEPAMNVGMGIVWKKYQVFSKAADRFLQILQDKFA